MTDHNVFNVILSSQGQGKIWFTLNDKEMKFLKVLLTNLQNYDFKTEKPFFG